MSYVSSPVYCGIKLFYKSLSCLACFQDLHRESFSTGGHFELWVDYWIIIIYYSLAFLGGVNINIRAAVYACRNTENIIKYKIHTTHKIVD